MDRRHAKGDVMRALVFFVLDPVQRRLTGCVVLFFRRFVDRVLFVRNSAVFAHGKEKTEKFHVEYVHDTTRTFSRVGHVNVRAYDRVFVENWQEVNKTAANTGGGCVLADLLGCRECSSRSCER